MKITITGSQKEITAMQRQQVMFCLLDEADQAKATGYIAGLLSGDKYGAADLSTHVPRTSGRSAQDDTVRR